MRVKLIFKLLFFFTFCFCSANAQTWRSINGSLESDVRDIIIEDDTIYIASLDPGGFFKKRIDSSQWYYSEIAEREGAFRSGILGLLSINVDRQGNYYAGGGGSVTIGDGQAYDFFLGLTIMVKPGQNSEMVSKNVIQ